MRKSAVILLSLSLLGTGLLGSGQFTQASEPESKPVAHDTRTKGKKTKEKKVGPFVYVFQEYVVVEDFPFTAGSTPSSPGQINGLLNALCARSNLSGMQVELQADGTTLAVTSLTPEPVTNVTRSQGSRSAAEFAAGFAKYQGLCQMAARFPRVKKYPFYKMIFGTYGANSPAATIPASGLSGVRYGEPRVSTVCMIWQGQILKCG